MKTYEQVINQAVLTGFHSYFGGGSMYSGAHEYVTAALFIYGVSREQFMDDFDRMVKDVEVEKVMNDWTSDQVIAYLKNR
jgi:hypothetical protein